MRKITLFIFLISFCTSHLNASTSSTNSFKLIDYIKISQDFLYAIKTGDSTTRYIDTLSRSNEDVLAEQLKDDSKRLVFWLNIYNGFTQVILKNDPDQYKTRGSFFSSRQINIAGQQLSLDDIEHGILRHSKIKWSEGYLGKLFPSAFEKKFRVKKLDYRIHFALNCGAKSCPAIAFYEPENIDKQLDLAIETYLTGECEYDSVKNTVSVPALMGWFRNDFGGKTNMVEILKDNNIIPRNRMPKIHFKAYDWTLFLDNYKALHND